MKFVNMILYKYSNMDGSSQILIFLIILVILMLISIFIINMITNKKSKKMITNSDNTLSKVSKKLDIIDNIDTNLNIDDDIEKIEDNVVEVKIKKTSIDDVSRLIQNTLEEKPIDLTNFEVDQEENAIISYDELVKKAGAKKIVYKCEDENISNDEVLKTKNEYEQSKFKASKIISPVYGVQNMNLKDKNDNEDEDIEILSDIDFLSSLKNFRNELD